MLLHVLIGCTVFLSIVITFSVAGCLKVIREHHALKEKELSRLASCRQGSIYTLEMAIDRIYNALREKRDLTQEYWDLTCYGPHVSLVTLERKEKVLIKKAFGGLSDGGNLPSVTEIIKLSDDLLGLAAESADLFKEEIFKEHQYSRMTVRDRMYRRATIGIRRCKFER